MAGAPIGAAAAPDRADRGSGADQAAERNPNIPRSAERQTASSSTRRRIVLPFQLQTEHGIVSLISTVTVFGTPIDVTVAELALECFYPADTATADILPRIL